MALAAKAEEGDPFVVWILSKALRRAKKSPKVALQPFLAQNGQCVTSPQNKISAWTAVFC